MKNGPYTLVKAPNNYPGITYRGERRYVYEHRLVWWQNTGEVADGFTVHHKNENKRDNRFSNLEKLTRGEHTALHAPETPMVKLTCARCGAEFELEKRHHDFKARKGQTRFFCSRSHAISTQQTERWAKIRWQRAVPGK